MQRIADEVPVWNAYPAFGEFTLKPHLRYLFEVYPGVRGDSLFRAKDRMYLLKCIVDRHFDFDHLEAAGE